jgi:hypothetical protein
MSSFEVAYVYVLCGSVLIVKFPRLRMGGMYSRIYYEQDSLKCFTFSLGLIAIIKKKVWTSPRDIKVHKDFAYFKDSGNLQWLW